MPVAICVLALAGLAIPNLAFGQEARPRSTGLWFWLGNCNSGQAMGVEIIVDRKPVYRSSFRACRMQRIEADVQQQRKTRTFHFSGGHTFQDTHSTARQEQVEGSVWQAGADPDDILLGISFVAHNQILLNTIHIVRPGHLTQSILDRGIVVRTYPLNSKGVKASADETPDH